MHRAGVEVLGNEERKVRSPKNILDLLRLILSWGPDVVQANLYGAEVLVALCRVMSPGGSTVSVNRHANTDFLESRSQTAYRWFDRFYLKTIACSSTVAEQYRSFHRDGGMKKLVTINNGGLFPEIIPTGEQRRAARRELNVPERAFAVAHIGRMFPGDRNNRTLRKSQKAHDVLIQSFAEAFRGDPDCILLMVGEGPLMDEAKNLVGPLGLEKVALFLGQQTEPWSVLEAAEMFCFPSWFEGMPNVLLEAASCGLPIVASDIPEIRDHDPDNAWLLRPVDDIPAFSLAMREVRGKIGENQGKARDAAKGIEGRYSMGVCARKYLELYKEALAQKEK